MLKLLDKKHSRDKPPSKRQIINKKLQRLTMYSCVE